MSWWDDAKNFGTGFVVGGPGGGMANLVSGGKIGGKISGSLNDFVTSPDAALEAQRKRALQEQAAKSGQFADSSQANYNQLGTRGNTSLDALQAIANGQNSVSAEQLRQGLQQQLGQQQSMAAGASPQNAAMAARTAAIQSARLGSGLAGQQAVAGLQERNQAQQNYAGLLQGLRGQDANTALGARNTAVAGYGANNAGQPAPSDLQKWGPAIQGGIEAYKLSDRSLKTDIKPGDTQAAKSLNGLKSHFFAYKDPKDGSGKQIGVMTDDLKKAGLGHAVIKTPRGEAVHSGALATSLAAMMPGIRDRLEKLEAKSSEPRKAKRAY